MVIIRGHRGVADAYACHVLDIYDHYAWRFLLKQHPDIFGQPLEGDDKWQERYIAGANEKAPELRFWLSAASGGDTSSLGPLPPHKDPPAPEPAPGPVKKKPAAKKKPVKKKPAKKKKTRKKKPAEKKKKTAKKKAAEKK